jgi:Ca2+-binding RTX toxin-like protein
MNICARIHPSRSDTLHGGDGADQLRGGDGTDTLYGDAGNDALWGNAGADTLSGGNGNDTISGGDGSDSLTGGSGADTFVFRQGETGSDTISDFSTGDGDKIDIHQLLTGFDPLTSDITDFVHVTASGGNAIVSVDVDGPAGGAANFVAIATLTGASALAGTEADLLTNGNLIAHV